MCVFLSDFYKHLIFGWLLFAGLERHLREYQNIGEITLSIVTLSLMAIAKTLSLMTGRVMMSNILIELLCSAQHFLLLC